MNYSLQNALKLVDSDETQTGEKLRLIAIGSASGVTETIHTLHALGYAEVGAWSPILPVPNSQEMMSILTRTRSLR